MDIYFTRHAEEKFDVLLRHGVRISKEKVIDAVANSEVVEYGRHPLLIAQKSLSKNKVLRVVYKKNKNVAVVITFYPGKKKQYEKK